MICVCGQDPDLLSAKPLRKVPVNYMPTNEPITETVLRDVASQLGPEWSTVAAALGVSRPRVQFIQRNAMLLSSPPLVMNFEMLMMWAKALPKCADKVRAHVSRCISTTCRYINPNCDVVHLIKPRNPRLYIVTMLHTLSFSWRRLLR